MPRYNWPIGYRQRTEYSPSCTDETKRKDANNTIGVVVQYGSIFMQFFLECSVKRIFSIRVRAYSRTLQRMDVGRHQPFHARDASAERGDATVSRLSVCLSVCDDQVPCSNRLEFFENNNFTTEQLKAHALVDAQHGRSGATGTPPKLGWNIGCELELNYRGDNAHLLTVFTCDVGRFPRLWQLGLSGRCTLCTRQSQFIYSYCYDLLATGSPCANRRQTDQLKLWSARWLFGPCAVSLGVSGH